MSDGGVGRDTASLASLIREVSDELRTAQVPSPEHDAIDLIAHVLGLAPAEVRVAAARGDSIPSDFARRGLDDLIERRVRREPLQHLTGIAHFRGLDILVGPGVFVPRPETEVVAGAAIDAARTLGGDGRVLVADLCSGSGAIGLSIAHEVPGALVTLVEVDDAAMAWLRRNVEASPTEVASRIEAVHADATRALPRREGDFDVVVANPPYIPSDGIPVAPEALHDPSRALWGLGDDGLEVPTAVAAAAARLLRRGGLLIMEHADTQGESLRNALSTSGAWHNVRTGRDLTGRERFALAIRA